MNRTADKGIVDAARYFKEEVLEIMPDIPAEQLSDMVSSYVYYQQADVTRDQAQSAVRETYPQMLPSLSVPACAPRRRRS